MGRVKYDASAIYTFAPKISSNSKKLAARKLQSLQDTGLNLPHFMLNIKCKEPLAPISQKSEKGKEDEADIEKINLDIETSVAESELTTNKLEKAPCNNKPTYKEITSTVQQYQLRTGMMGSKAEVLLDESIFTFKPKVSMASAKIVENLGTDFMARQQQHLERQKRHIEQAPIHFSSFSGRLSPVTKMKKQKKNTKETEGEEDDAVKSSSDVTIDNEDSQQPCELTPEEKEEEADSMPANLSLSRNKSTLTSNLQRILDGPYANGNPDLVMKRKKKIMGANQFKGKPLMESGDLDDSDISGSLSRSKTMPMLGRAKIGNRKMSGQSSMNCERLKHAKETAEKAIKQRKIFTIQGGYSAVRHSLRKRGWIEKFYRIPGPPKKTRRKKKKVVDDEDSEDDGAGGDSDDDDDGDTDGDDTDDSDNDQPKTPPWEEEDGLYGIMSRMVRNVNPTFIWVLKRDIIDYRFLTKDQMVNHYCKAGSFTTKVGLCVNMRNVPWFENADPEQFFPRCYRLSHEEEKAAFIDDYRLTACMGVLKLVAKHNSRSSDPEPEQEEPEEEEKVEKDKSIEEEAANFVCTNPECTRSRPGDSSANICIHAEERLKALQKEKEDKVADLNRTPRSQMKMKKPVQKKRRPFVPLQCLEKALRQCERYLQEKNHDDIDTMNDPYELSQAQWDEFISWYYLMAHDGGMINNVPENMLNEVEHLINRLKTYHPQFELDGVKDVWIVKPGAKSRGRGIVCYHKLEDMLKLVNSQVVRKDNKYVVQKYMERPLLIYNTKFDIRQWFLVTDWNPLTIWFYQDSYLRFCSQEYTLDDFDESIHLSNNAIQKHYKNGPRNPKLPSDNMWSHEQFKDYMKSQKVGHLWDDVVYSGMKKAIICALLCTQDLIEYRKSSFELYGADFMLTEDYKPWLIEINSSPSMESSTPVTQRLCSSVLEDTIKVVVDRRYDRNCDIGRFELAYKQPLVTVPPYIGISLIAEGNTVRKPPGFLRRNADSENNQFFSPRKSILESKDNNKQSFNNTGVSKRPHSENDSSSNKHFAVSASSAKTHTKSSSNDSTVYFASRNQRKLNTKNTLNTSGLNTRKSPSASATHVSSSHSSANQSETGGDVGSVTSNDKENHPVILASGFPRPEKSVSLPTNGFMAMPGKRIVSRQSVSGNYTIPFDKQERATLAVNNVESTDLQTIKPAPPGASSKGVTALIDGTWSRTCSDCGAGNNIHLDHSNPNCKCRQDSICIAQPGGQRARSARAFFPRPRSSYGSPRPPSACSNHEPLCNASSQSSSTNLALVATSSPRTEKVLLRYTDAGIQQPTASYGALGGQLPKIIRRYIGRRNAQCHEIPIVTAHSTAIYLDTKQLSNPLSIMSHGVSNR